jgi:hypothetical protein
MGNDLSKWGRSSGRSGAGTGRPNAPPDRPTLPQILARRFELDDDEQILAIVAARTALGHRLPRPDFGVVEVAVGTRTLTVAYTGRTPRVVVHVALTELTQIRLVEDVRGWGNWLEARAKDGSDLRLLLPSHGEAMVLAEILELAVSRASDR